MNFIFDNNLPPALARAINELTKSHWAGKHSVIHITQQFQANTPDQEWLTALANEPDKEWVVITHDKLAKGIEREILRRSGLRVFVLNKSWAQHNYWNKAQNLVRWWERIVEQAEGVTKGAFVVTWNFSGKGQFEVL